MLGSGLGLGNIQGQSFAGPSLRKPCKASLGVCTLSQKLWEHPAPTPTPARVCGARSGICSRKLSLVALRWTGMGGQ